MRASFIFIIFATCFALKLYKQSLKTEFVRLCQICTDVPPPIGVLGTVCGVIGLRKGSQSDVLLRLFDRGFGNGLQSIWVSEAVAKCCVSACFRVGFWKRSAGHLGFGGGRKVLCACVFSSGRLRGIWVSRKSPGSLKTTKLNAFRARSPPRNGSGRGQK